MLSTYGHMMLDPIDHNSFGVMRSRGPAAYPKKRAAAKATTTAREICESKKARA